jgi:hypothetical protein
MDTWEYARFVAMPPRIADRDLSREEITVVLINEMVQDFKNKPMTPWQVLNEMGGEGWELVTVLAVVPPSANAVKPTGVWEYILKRPVRQG